MSMKRIIYLLLILNLGLFSCVDDASVRVMPEFNCKDTKVNLAKAAGSSVTSLLYTNVGQVVAQYQAEWLSVDVNAKSIIYTALTQNDGEDARSTVVKLTCGSYTVEVTVTQDSKEPDLSLKVGQSVDDGIGMIFWVDPSDKMVGKAVSVKRQGGNPFEASVMSHNALSPFHPKAPNVSVKASGLPRSSVHGHIHPKEFLASEVPQICHSRHVPMFYCNSAEHPCSFLRHGAYTLLPPLSKFQPVDRQSNP